jgi:hypothetical protein
MVNIAPKSSKRTEIRIHSSPSKIEFVQNMLYSSAKELWRVVISVGPFFKFHRAVVFFRSWADKTRGCPSRLTRGISLALDFSKSENLSLYVTPFSASDGKSIFKDIELLKSAFFATPIADDIVKNEKENVSLKELISQDRIKKSQRNVLMYWWNNRIRKESSNTSSEEEDAKNIYETKFSDIF